MAIEGLEPNGYMNQAWNYLKTPSIDPINCLKLKISGIALLLLSAHALANSALPVIDSIGYLFAGTTSILAGYTGKPIYFVACFLTLIGAATLSTLTTHVRAL